MRQKYTIEDIKEVQAILETTNNIEEAILLSSFKQKANFYKTLKKNGGYVKKTIIIDG